MIDMWYVYILECKNKSLYTGITNDLKRRLKEHKSGKGAKYTRAFAAEKLLYSENKRSRINALKREAQIKALTKQQKLLLVSREGQG
jgi:putative endonuclease